jgi:hypothetical protein
MSTLRQAVIKAIQESEHWAGGAVVLRMEDDGYVAYAGACVPEVLRHHPDAIKVWQVTSPTNVGGPGATVEDAEELADRVLPDIKAWG